MSGNMCGNRRKYTNTNSGPKLCFSVEKGGKRTKLWCSYVLVVSPIECRGDVEITICCEGDHR